ncbi:uncharacterized protein LOC115954252 [Quercus lobata]|uniref:uncharacterized protein LOC115954252 n=1 Tax=Quercus lobata TaxID=97700 RepID=UPI001243C989|nr:uncharacterized protein LOC115954252 [Quercus lobata]
MAWSIWYQRNKTQPQENPLPLCNIIGFAKNYLSDFRSMIRPSVQRKRDVPRKWIPPIADMVKINYDGAMFGESDMAGIGVVIQDHKGQVMAALFEKIAKPPTMDFIELLVARPTISFSAQLGHVQGVCEGDSESVVNALKGSGMENSRGGHLIKDILSLSNSFQSISFAHVGRQGNAVAHALAQQARSSPSSQVWLKCVPTDILSFVLNDFPFS